MTPSVPLPGDQDQGTIRVVVNGLHAKTGGGVTYLRSVVPLLAADPRFELHLLLHVDQYELFAQLDERVRLHLFTFRPGMVTLLLWEQLALPILLRAMGADVTFSPANFGPLMAPNSVNLLRNSLAVVRGEARAGKRIYWMGLAIATVLSTLCSRRTIAVSSYALRALTFGLPARVRRKITVVHHGVSPLYSPAEAEVPREEFFLVVADIYIQKNLHTLVEAVARLKAKHPKVRIRIAGRIVDEDYYAQIEGKIRSSGLHDVFEFLGPVDQVYLVDLYRRCLALVFPSTVETFGNPLVEAMACGTPIASSNAAAMPEILGDACLYFNPLNADSIAESLEKLIQDSGQRERLSRLGLERVREFALLRTAAMTAQVLRSAAGL